MKLVVFLKNKKEVRIKDGKTFLKQRYSGAHTIILGGKKQTKILRKHIIDFIQDHYYVLVRQSIYRTRFAY